MFMRLSARSVVSGVFILLVALGLVTTAFAQNARITDIRVEGAGYVSPDIVMDSVKDILKRGNELSAEDMRAAEEAVNKLGYYDQVVVSQRVVPGGVEVIITVIEKKRIEKVLFVGNTVFTDEQLSAAIRSKVGGLVDNRLVERDASRIQEVYSQGGYLARVARAEVDNFGVLTFVLDEARVEAIRITGLKRTQEWVVRRQIELKEGELFQDRRIMENIRKVQELGIFKTVTSDVLPGVLDPVKGVIIEFKIEENKTGQFNFALAYSSLDNLVLMLAVQESNFRGEAEKVQASVEAFGRTSYSLNYVEPFFDHHNTSLEVDLYDTERKRQFVGGLSLTESDSEFDERRTGGSIRIARPLDSLGRRKWNLRLRSEKVSSSTFQGTRIIDNGSGIFTSALGESDENWPADNGDLLPDVPEPGDIIGPINVAAPLHPGGRINSVTLGFTNDMREVIKGASAGHYSSVTAQMAGYVLGGEKDFSQVTLEHRRFYPIRENKDTLAFRAMAGFTLGDVPLFESFSVGGSNSLRGYEDDRFRGEKMVLFNAEYRRPISDSLTAVAFVDVGDAFGGSFDTDIPGFTIEAEDTSLEPHVGAGLGARIITPIGPLRLDVGWGDEGTQVHFSFGQAF